LRRAKVRDFFAGLEPCLIGLEACGTAHFWGRLSRVTNAARTPARVAPTPGPPPIFAPPSPRSCCWLQCCNHERRVGCGVYSPAWQKARICPTSGPAISTA
jgi:hypothetical protein